MNLYNRSNRSSILAAGLIDGLLALGAYYLAFWLRSLTSFGIFSQPLPASRFLQVPHYPIFLFILQILLLYFFGLYEQEGLNRPMKFLQRFFSVVILEVLLLIAYYFFRQAASLAFPRTIFILYPLLNLLLLLLWRKILQLGLFREQQQPKVLIIGANAMAEDLIREIRRLPHSRIQVIGVVSGPEDQPRSEVSGVPVLGSYQDAQQIAQQKGANEVIIASTPTWQQKVVDHFICSQSAVCRLSVLPTSYEILLGRMSRLRIYDIPLFELLRAPASPWQRFVERCLDLIVAIIALVILLPVALLVALAVKLSSPGPVIFRQVRVGRYGKNFKILKFRTMVQDAEKNIGPVLSTPQDPRITPAGRFLRKTRLDEIPQLINVLRGEMSLVGPRPERPHFVAKFCECFPAYRERLAVKPGLTGLAQVNGAYDTSAANKLKYDLAYIYNKSLLLDLRILLETVKVVLAGEGEPTRETDQNFFNSAQPPKPASPGDGKLP